MQWVVVVAVLADILPQIARFWGRLSQISCSFDWELRKKSWRWRIEVEGLRTESLVFKIEVKWLWLWINDRQYRFEDSIMSYLYVIHILFLVILVKLWIFCLRTICIFSMPDPLFPNFGKIMNHLTSNKTYCFIKIQGNVTVDRK